MFLRRGLPKHTRLGKGSFARVSVPTLVPHGCDPRYATASNATTTAHHLKLLHTSALRLHDSRQSNANPTLERFKSNFDFLQATCNVESLSAEHEGQEVVLHGYLQPQRNISTALSFAQLLSPEQDAAVQILSTSANQTLHEIFKDVRPYSPVAIKGIVQSKKQPKKPSRESQKRRIETVEIKINDLKPLNAFPADLNFSEQSTFEPSQRHLEIRHSDEMRGALKFRSKLASTCREYLERTANFTEVETPLLFKSTPEGAREFLVPTRVPGEVYALPQSPQQYKQILMASGIPRYYQLARCFRDEDLRADRQPEFTQLDLEMAFATGQDVMTLIEGLIKHIWATAMSFELPSEPFPRLSYQDAMSRYGSDKPDRRLHMEILKIGHLVPVDLVSKLGSLTNPIVEAFKFDVSEDPNDTRNFVSDFMDSTESAPFIQNPDGQPGIFIYDSRKPLGGLTPFGFEAAELMEEQFELEDGNLIIVQVRKDEPFQGGSTALGNLRLALHKLAVSKGLVSKPNAWDFLWVNKFPLFSPSNTDEPGQGGDAGIASTHHPFTAPETTEEIDKLSTEPLSVIADHYDLVLNGVEIGGGSRRIHNHELQEYILKETLKMDEKRLLNFTHLLEVLRSGCPPHAGIALGFDRLCAIMLGKESIRDVIAFPKNGSGQDLLVQSPSKVTLEQLKTYHLRPV